MQAAEILSFLPEAAAVLAVLALVLCFVVRGTRLTAVRRDLGQLRAGVEWIDSNQTLFAQGTQVLRNQISELSDSVKQLDSAAKPAIEDEAIEQQSAVDARVERFVKQLTELWRVTSIKLRGDEKDDWEAIDALTVPGRSSLNDLETEAAFAPPARRILQFAVQAAPAKGTSVDQLRVSDLLDELATMLGMQLVNPTLGHRFDPSLHELVTSFPAGGNQRGTIAEVATRGLVRPGGNVLKAKVYLYD